MKKHQCVKSDCNCVRRATYFKCKHCGTIEYCSQREIQTLDAHRATCTDPAAPEAPPTEKFKSMMGGTFDCLAPDFETWEQEQKDATAATQRGASS